MVARDKHLHDIVASELSIEVSVTEPGVLQVLNRGAMVLEVDDTVRVEVKRFIIDAEVHWKSDVEIAHQHVDVGNIQVFIRVEIARLEIR